MPNFPKSIQKLIWHQSAGHLSLMLLNISVVCPHGVCDIRWKKPLRWLLQYSRFKIICNNVAGQRTGAVATWVIGHLVDIYFLQMEHIKTSCYRDFTFQFRFHVYMVSISGMSSGLFLAAMSIDRLIAVRFPLAAARLCTAKRAKLTVILIPIFIMIFNINIFFVFDYFEDKKTGIIEEFRRKNRQLPLLQFSVNQVFFMCFHNKTSISNRVCLSWWNKTKRTPELQKSIFVNEFFSDFFLVLRLRQTNPCDVILQKSYCRYFRHNWN
jgi:hypothetical protein